MILLLFTFGVSFLMVGFMLPRVLILSLRKRLIDPIDPRKVHSVPASRLGGITFFPAIIFASWLTIALTSVAIPSIGEILNIDVTMILESLSLLTLFMVGIYDDIIGVSYRKKFAVQIFAAILIIISGAYFKTLNGFMGIYDIPNYIGIPATIGFYIFVTNSINLIDGIDGLASSLSMMALAVYTILLYSNGLIEDSLTTAAAFGALLPFWYGNVFGVKRGVGSKIFMGDTGALVIGALLGFIAVTVWNIPFDNGYTNMFNDRYSILAYTMLLVPCFDVIRIVIHRYRDKQPLFLPDKNHIHHKFMALGYSPRQALMHIFIINAIFLSINFALSFVLGITYIVIIDVLIWTIMHISISKRIKNKKYIK